MAKLDVVLDARFLALALQGLVAHLVRGIRVVSDLVRSRSVAEGERLLPQAITNELVHGGHDERDGGALVAFEQLGDASRLPQDGCAFLEVVPVFEAHGVLAPRLACSLREVLPFFSRRAGALYTRSAQTSCSSSATI